MCEADSILLPTSVPASHKEKKICRQDFFLWQEIIHGSLILQFIENLMNFTGE